MTSDKLLKISELTKRDQEGLDMEDGRVYPWASIGPIEQATLAALQEAIRVIRESESENGTLRAMTVEEAKDVVSLQRRYVRKVLPTMPDDVLNAEISDEGCGLIIGFFEVSRMEQSADTMEKQVMSAEKAQAMAARARSIGAEMSRPSRGTTEATRRVG